MRKLFESGAAFFIVAVMSVVVALFMEDPAVFISLGVLWFIIGLAVRKDAEAPETGGASESDGA